MVKERPYTLHTAGMSQEEAAAWFKAEGKRAMESGQRRCGGKRKRKVADLPYIWRLALRMDWQTELLTGK
jgi:hypothetical protein